MIGSVNPYSYIPNYYPAPDNRRVNAPEPSPVKTLVTAGLLQGAAMLLQKTSGWFGNKLMQGKEFTTAENVKNIAKNMVDKNGLDVTVSYIDQNNINKFPQQLRQSLVPVARGENAFYMDSCKLAVAPKSKPSLILHELGHAINARKGGILKLLQKSRGYVSAAPTALLMLNGLFEHKDGKKNFVEKNAGFLGFAAFLPTIIEEGLASLRGLKAAKSTLGKTVSLKCLKRNYFFAWMTYVIAGLGLGIAAKQAFVENGK